MANANQNQHVLIAPLNWGLGHATRCIPLIDNYINNGYQVSIAAEGLSKKILLDSFPHLNFIDLKGYNIYYPVDGNMAWAMFKQAPKIIYGIYKEHQLLKAVIKKHGIDIIISDNRYGLWNKAIRSIIITHQINIQVPKKLKLLGGIINAINHFFISKYIECWIPDYEGKTNLSGNLSHKKPGYPNTKFIGPLSRFKKILSPNTKYDLVIVLSGPESQITVLENLIYRQIIKLKISTLLVRGSLSIQTYKNSNKKLEVKNLLAAEELNQIMLGAKYIICRSGYSSIMDLVAIDKTAMLIPTPGQTEQEYLATYLSIQKLFLYQTQSNFDLAKVIKDLKVFKPNKLEE